MKVSATTPVVPGNAIMVTRLQLKSLFPIGTLGLGDTTFQTYVIKSHILGILNSTVCLMSTCVSSLEIKLVQLCSCL